MRQTEYRSQGATQPKQAQLSLARRIAAVISECDYAQRRMLDLHMAPGRDASDRGRAQPACDRVAC
jgi:hypothetical protein